MNQRRVFTLINIALIGIIGFFGYYLAESTYSEPGEIQPLLDMVERMTPTPAPIESIDERGHDWDELKAATMYEPLIKKTPKPTPAPTATPRRWTLEEMLYPWKIIGMTSTSVRVSDPSKSEEFDMKLNGTGRQVELKSQTMTVTLCKVDLATLTATFCGGGQERELSFGS